MPHYSLAENDRSTNYSQKEIQKQLDLIISNELFALSVVLSNFLKFVVKETLKCTCR